MSNMFNLNAGLFDNLVSLAFPSTYKPSNTGVDYSRTDTEKMSPEEYNQWFQGQGRVAKSYPVATALGGVRAAKFLRDSFLRRPIKPSPTTAPLALTDQSQTPVNAPLDLGPTEPLMLEAPLAVDDIPFDEEDFIIAQANNNNLPFDDFDFEGDDDIEMEVAGPPLSDEEFYTKPEGFYSALEKKTEGGNLSKEEKDSAIREIKYRTMASDATMKKDIYLDNLWRDIMDDPNKSLYDYFDADEEGNLIDWKDFVLKDLPADRISSVPNINDPENLKEFMDKNPLQFTVRRSKDQYGDGIATHLYFGGTKPNEQNRQHFITNGRAAQAFIRYNTDDGLFNVVEVQNEMRGGGDAYAKQVVSKLAQQTVLDWARPQRYEEAITIPTGEAIFKFYQSNLGFGRPLWPEEIKLLNLKDNDKFDEQASEFYNQPLILNEASKIIDRHIQMVMDASGRDMPDFADDFSDLSDKYGEEYLDRIQMIANEIKNNRTVGGESYIPLREIHTKYRLNLLKDAKKDYQGKVKHYNEYLKQLKKSLKQHGANIEEHKHKNETIIRVINPEETRRNTNDDGFTIAMDIPKEKSKRRVA